VRAYEAKGLYDKAVEADLKQRYITGGRVQEAIPMLKKAYASGGWKAYWQKALEKGISEAHPFDDSYSIAVMYARLGEKELALQSLETASDERICLITSIKVTPELDSLRSEPRFQELQRRIGLTQ
jgi:hypothetical protein